MSLRIRRGTNAQRASITFDLGEIAYTTDTKKLYIGDGTTVGGKHVLATSAGNGFTFNETTQQIEFSLDNLDLDNLNLSTTGVPEGTRLYFTTERAQDAVGAALVAGNPFNTGVTFTYDDENNRITAISTGAGNSGIASVSADTTPSLGGNLGLNGFNISGSGTISATSLSSTTLTVTNLGGNLNAGSYNISSVGSLGATTVTATNLNATNLTGNLNAGTYNISSIGSLGANTISATTGLGANLSLNTNTINGTGKIEITGSISVNQTDNFQLRSLIGVGGYGYITTTAHRGTFASPTAVQAGDELGGILIRGNTSSSTSGLAGLIGVVVDPTAVINSGDFVKSLVVISASTDTMQNEGDAVIIDSAGVITSNAFVASKYSQLAVYANDTARTSAIPTPAKGMMVFMTSGTAPTVTNKSVVYDGSAWVALH